jgi:hypothetical protein
LDVPAIDVRVSARVIVEVVGKPGRMPSAFEPTFQWDWEVLHGLGKRFGN